MARVIPTPPPRTFKYYDWNNPVVGEYVYKAYTPVHVGVIVNVGPVTQSKTTRQVTIRMLNGKEITDQCGSFKCLRSLHEEHRSKAEKFQDIITKLDNSNPHRA